MAARLFVIPGSHPARTAALMLDRKGIAYDRTDLIPVVSKGVLRAAGFPRVTVPALRIEGERIQGSREISRALDRLVPDPPLFPADPDRRAAVEDAERFGDEELQHPIRQLLWWGFKRGKDNLRAYSEGARLGIPIGLAIKTGGPLVALSARFNEATDANARAALAALPDLLDRVDAYVADGTIGGEEPNAADFQIATSIGLALTLDDLVPLIEPRPAAALARRIVPDYPGHMPPIFPPAWLPEPAARRAGS
jgi:glutathione S-transferase